MLNEDLILSKRVDAEALRQAIATAAGLPVSAVCVVEGNEVEPAAGAAEVALVVERVEAAGDYPLAVEYWPRGEVPKDGRLDEIRELCALLDCRALVDDGTAIPGRFLEVGASGPLRFINLDGDREVDGTFVARSEEPLSSVPQERKAA